MPKYLEYQFNLTPGQAAMVVGCLSVPAGAGGTLLGGYLLKRLSLDRTGAIKLYLFCQAIIIPLYFGFLIHCPTPPLQGINYFEAANATQWVTFEFMRELIGFYRFLPV